MLVICYISSINRITHLKGSNPSLILMNSNCPRLAVITLFRFPMPWEFRGVPRNLIIIFRDLEIPWIFKKYMENREKSLITDSCQIYISKRESCLFICTRDNMACTGWPPQRCLVLCRTPPALSGPLTNAGGRECHNILESLQFTWKIFLKIQ